MVFIFYKSRPDISFLKVHIAQTSFIPKVNRELGWAEKDQRGNCSES